MTIKLITKLHGGLWLPIKWIFRSYWSQFIHLKPRPGRQPEDQFKGFFKLNPATFSLLSAKPFHHCQLQNIHDKKFEQVSTIYRKVQPRGTLRVGDLVAAWYVGTLFSLLPTMAKPCLCGGLFRLCLVLFFIFCCQALL